jgi:hypothetical protein
MPATPATPGYIKNGGPATLTAPSPGPVFTSSRFSLLPPGTTSFALCAHHITHSRRSPVVIHPHPCHAAISQKRCFCARAVLLLVLVLPLATYLASPGLAESAWPCACACRLCACARARAIPIPRASPTSHIATEPRSRLPLYLHLLALSPPPLHSAPLSTLHSARCRPGRALSLCPPVTLSLRPLSLVPSIRSIRTPSSSSSPTSTPTPLPGHSPTTLRLSYPEPVLPWLLGSCLLCCLPRKPHPPTINSLRSHHHHHGALQTR